MRSFAKYLAGLCSEVEQCVLWKANKGMTFNEVEGIRQECINGVFDTDDDFSPDITNKVEDGCPPERIYRVYKEFESGL